MTLYALKSDQSYVHHDLTTDSRSLGPAVLASLAAAPSILAKQDAEQDLGVSLGWVVWEIAEAAL